MPGVVARASRMMMRLYPFPRGQGRIVDRSPLGRLRFPEDTLDVRTREGFEMTVWPNDLIGRHLYLTGQFDQTIVHVLRRFARGGDVMLDIGANIGFVSCAMLWGDPEARIVSVEPNPETCALLRRNLERVAAGRGRAMEAAVSDHDGGAELIIGVGNTGGSRIAHNGEAQGARTAHVRLISAETLLRECGLDRLDLVKIDVEGHEEAVIRSLGPVLKRLRPNAAVFEHGGDLSAADSSICKTLDEAGYDVRGVRKSLTAWSLATLDEMREGGFQCHDYVATPREHAR